MRIVRWLLPLIACSALAAAPSRAPERDTFEILVGEKAAGTEIVTRTLTDKGTKLKSRVDLTIPSGTVTFIQESAIDGSRIRDYLCDVEVGGQTTRIRATPSMKGWKVEAGPASAADASMTQEIPVTGTAVIIDNNLASHLDLFCRGLALEPGASTSLTAVVPQAMQAFPLKATRTPDGQGTLDGATVSTRRYRLELTSLLLELECRSSDGALLLGKVPLQKAVYRRKGYAAAESPKEAADPRETTTSVSSAVGALPAVLTIPQGAASKPVPAAVMLSGSGPNDRDETIGPNKPFRDLARGLADRGVATLRYDKRTVVIKDPALASTLRDEYVVDALEALKVLRAAPGVDPARIFVIGHSLGALAAPVVAKEAEGVRGIVLLAGPARPADELLVDQIGYQAKIAGQDAAAIEAQRKEISGALAKIKDPANNDAAPFLGAPAAYWRDLLRYDLTALLRDGKLPVLVLQGEKDIQVRPDLDFELLRQRLGDAGGRITYRSFPGLNHLFIPVEGISTGAEYGAPGRVDPAVATAISDWLKAR